MLCTPQALMAIAGASLPRRQADLLSPLFNTICPKWGINTRDRFEEFISTLMEESARLTVLSENMYYRADRILEIFPSVVKTRAQANSLAMNPRKLAETVYGTGQKAKDLGNLSREDGWNMRGAGPIQCTGRGIIARYAKRIGKTPEQAAELMRTSWEWGIDSACWVFAVEKGLLDEADRDDFETITRRVAGRLTNWEQRKVFLHRALKYLPR
jgi:predicted chitinase